MDDVSDRVFDRMKRWLANGEWDLDLAIRMGVTSRKQIIEICRALVDSPWRRPTQDFDKMKISP